MACAVAIAGAGAAGGAVRMRLLFQSNRAAPARLRWAPASSIDLEQRPGPTVVSVQLVGGWWWLRKCASGRSQRLLTPNPNPMSSHSHPAISIGRARTGPT